MPVLAERTVGRRPSTYAPVTPPGGYTGTVLAAGGDVLTVDGDVLVVSS